MKLRHYDPADCAVLAGLFYQTVHTVNVKDYTAAQIAAWATGTTDLCAWNKSFLEHTTLVCDRNGTLVGFGDMDDSGYLDRLYVHKDYQRKGIATAIVDALEQQAALHGISVFTTHASITAKPFFEARGYRTICENTVVRKHVALTNFIMEKSCGTQALGEAQARPHSAE